MRPGCRARRRLPQSPEMGPIAGNRVMQGSGVLPHVTARPASRATCRRGPHHRRPSWHRPRRRTWPRARAPAPGLTSRGPTPPPTRRQSPVQRCSGSTCTAFVAVAQLAATAKSWTDSGVKSRSTYRYRMFASNDAGRITVLEHRERDGALTLTPGPVRQDRPC